LRPDSHDIFNVGFTPDLLDHGLRLLRLSLFVAPIDLLPPFAFCDKSFDDLVDTILELLSLPIFPIPFAEGGTSYIEAQIPGVFINSCVGLFVGANSLAWAKAGLWYRASACRVHESIADTACLPR
jgi:hypothetical protein